MSFDRLLGQCGHARWNLPINRDVGDADFLNWCNQSARLARMSIKKTFAFECGDVLHDGCLTGETEMTLDFAGARCDPFFPLLVLDKIENVFLTIGQHAIMIAESDPCASSNEQIRCESPAFDQTAKLSPQEQCATAFGFVTLNPPFCRSSLKSSSEPLTKSALFGSTTTRTPAEFTIISRFAGPSTKSILYCRPEQPPPITATRSAPCGRPCLVSSEVSLVPAFSVTFTSFSLPILKLMPD